MFLKSVEEVKGQGQLCPIHTLPRDVRCLEGAAVAEWLSSWLAEQEDRGSIPGLAT